MEPSAAVADAQSVKTSGNLAETSHGIDTGKKTKGRKRHLTTNTPGLALTALVTTASAHDYEALPQRSRTMTHRATANQKSRELTGEPTPTRRTETDIPPIST
ncbi:transposase [Streptomyces albidoflavus]